MIFVSTRDGIFTIFYILNLEQMLIISTPLRLLMLAEHCVDHFDNGFVRILSHFADIVIYVMQ